MKMTLQTIAACCLLLWAAGCNPSGTADKKLRALIVDGQNNHGIWPQTTAMMQDYLMQSGRFEKVDVSRSHMVWQGPHNDKDEGMDEATRRGLLARFPAGAESMISEMPSYDPEYKPSFSGYDVVISNFGWTAAQWPTETRDSLERFVQNGGGLVIIHAADNSWPEWTAFNKMIGLGGWGERNEKSGPYVYYDNAGNLVRDTTKGTAGMHGHQYEQLITIRNTEHPITAGMPAKWLHAQDELYDRLRGPGENLTVLATAYSDSVANASFFAPYPGTNHHEPVAMTIDFGKGRVFHTPLGHSWYSFECVGFITLLQRGAEWAATGKVTNQTLPADFPTAEKSSRRTWTAPTKP